MLERREFLNILNEWKSHPEFIPILTSRDNQLSFEEVEAGRIAHPGNSS